MNSCYLEFIYKHKIVDENIKISIFRMLLCLTVNTIDETTYLSNSQINELIDLWKENNYEY
jgi:hypothetical protein